MNTSKGSLLKPFRNRRNLSRPIALLFLMFIAIAPSLQSHGYAQQANAIPAPTLVQTANAASSPGMAPTPPITGQQAVPVLDLEKQLLDFQKTLSESEKAHQDFLQGETTEHQKFLEWCYGLSIGLLTLVAVVCSGILAFFHYKSRKDIERVVSERIKATADKEIERAAALAATEISKTKEAADREMQSFQEHLEGHRTAVQAQMQVLEKEFRVNIDSITKLSVAFARACVILNQPSTSDPLEKQNLDRERQDIIQLFDEIKQWAPTNRTIGIFIGCLYRNSHEYDAAIRALDDTMLRRTNEHLDRGKDHSDLLFNKACYLNLKANEASVPESKIAIQKAAWDTLRQSIQMWPQNLTFAETDPDLSSLVNNERTWKNLQ